MTMWRILTVILIQSCFIIKSLIHPPPPQKKKKSNYNHGVSTILLMIQNDATLCYTISYQFGVILHRPELSNNN